MPRTTARVTNTTTPASPKPRTAGRKADKISKKTRVKVRAINPQLNTNTCGYYNHIRRREDDVFFIRGDRYSEDHPDKKVRAALKRRPELKGELIDFSPNWMEIVEPDAPLGLTTQKESMRKTHDRILAEQNPTPLSRDESDEDGDDDDEDDEDNPLNA